MIKWLICAVLSAFQSHRRFTLPICNIRKKQPSSCMLQYLIQNTKKTPAFLHSQANRSLICCKKQQAAKRNPFSNSITFASLPYQLLVSDFIICTSYALLYLFFIKLINCFSFVISRDSAIISFSPYTFSSSMRKDVLISLYVII